MTHTFKATFVHAAPVLSGTSKTIDAAAAAREAVECSA